MSRPLGTYGIRIERVKINLSERHRGPGWKIAQGLNKVFSKAMPEFTWNPLRIASKGIVAGAQSNGSKFWGKGAQPVGQHCIGFVGFSIPLLSGPAKGAFRFVCQTYVSI